MRYAVCGMQCAVLVVQPVDMLLKQKKYTYATETTIVEGAGTLLYHDWAIAFCSK